MSSSYKLKFETPSFMEVELKVGDNFYDGKWDLFVAYQEVVDSDKSPDEKTKWDRLRNYVSQGTQCPIDYVTVSVAYEFREAVIKASQELMDVVKKKLLPIASSQPPIPASPPTT